MDEGMMTKLGLTLNGAKTSLRDARQERFTFLGLGLAVKPVGER